MDTTTQRQSDTMSPPDWVKDAVFYQIFPDRFARSARLPKPDYLEAWEAVPTFRGYKGGDLYGIIEHLDHIETLGANALYLTPIFQAASNHRYNTHDYYSVCAVRMRHYAGGAIRHCMRETASTLLPESCKGSAFLSYST